MAFIDVYLSVLRFRLPATLAVFQGDLQCIAKLKTAVFFDFGTNPMIYKEDCAQGLGIAGKQCLPKIQTPFGIEVSQGFIQKPDGFFFVQHNIHKNFLLLAAGQKIRELAGGKGLGFFRIRPIEDKEIVSACSARCSKYLTIEARIASRNVAVSGPIPFISRSRFRG